MQNKCTNNSICYESDKNTFIYSDYDDFLA